MISTKSNKRKKNPSNKQRKKQIHKMNKMMNLNLPKSGQLEVELLLKSKSIKSLTTNFIRKFLKKLSKSRKGEQLLDSSNNRWE